MNSARVTAQITVEIDGSTFTFGVVGNATKLGSIRDVGAYLKIKCDEQLTRILGIDESDREIARLQKRLAELEGAAMPEPAVEEPRHRSKRPQRIGA